MQRITALWQASPLKLVSALFVLSLAAMMAVASGASFTSTSANAGNIVTAGNLTHSNSKAPGAILNVSGLKPGESQNGTVDITNTGDVDGVFTLSKSDVVNSDTGNPLSAKLDLLVEDLGDPAAPSAPVQKYNGKLGAMGADGARHVRRGRGPPLQVHRHVPRRRHSRRADHRRQRLQGRRRHGPVRLGVGQQLVMRSSVPTVRSRARRLAKVAGRGLVALLLLLTFAAIAVTFVPGLLGYQRYVLVGGSMEPTIHRGSLVFDELVRVRELRAGDVITYTPPGAQQARDPPHHLRQAPEDGQPDLPHPGRRQRRRRHAPVQARPADPGALPLLGSLPRLGLHRARHPARALPPARAARAADRARDARQALARGRRSWSPSAERPDAPDARRDRRRLALLLAIAAVASAGPHDAELGRIAADGPVTLASNHPGRALLHAEHIKPGDQRLGHRLADQQGRSGPARSSSASRASATAPAPTAAASRACCGCSVEDLSGQAPRTRVDGRARDDLPARHARRPRDAGTTA